MSVEKAKAHYIGKAGCRKLNCAQTIVHVFQDKFALPEEMQEQLAMSGGGRAPGGLCGSLYAAQLILERSCPDSFKTCEEAFLVHAGATRCQDIRRLKKLSCVGCVEKAAQCLELI